MHFWGRREVGIHSKEKKIQLLHREDGVQAGKKKSIHPSIPHQSEVLMNYHQWSRFGANAKKHGLKAPQMECYLWNNPPPHTQIAKKGGAWEGLFHRQDSNSHESQPSDKLLFMQSIFFPRRRRNSAHGQGHSEPPGWALARKKGSGSPAWIPPRKWVPLWRLSTLHCRHINSGKVAAGADFKNKIK